MSETEPLPAAHRPWPPPREPWVMFQVWEDLLFAHWRVPVEVLRPLVPAGLQIDTFQGWAWVGVVPFNITGIRMQLLPPLPGLTGFLEVNVRTYVTLEDKPGVWFFSLDAENPLAVAGARALFHLPYYNARISLVRRGDAIVYASHRSHAGASDADLELEYAAAGPVAEPEPGTLEHFLTERYCLYALDTREHTYRCEIAHPRWRLQPAEARIQANTLAQAAGIALPNAPPLLHYSRRQPAWIWRPRRIH